MDTIPFHLFDFVTLTRLSTLNKDYRARAAAKLTFMDKTAELISYLKSTEEPLDRAQKRRILNLLPLIVVWNIFDAFNKCYTQGSERYAYMMSPGQDAVSMNAYVSASHSFGIIMTSHNMIHIGTMPFIFGTEVFGHTMISVIAKSWDMLNLIAEGTDHICIREGRFVTWDAWNLRMLKIDTFRRKLFLSYTFAFKAEPQMSIPPIDTYFRHRASADLIRGVVYSFIMV
jgi:hypothetical protein